MSYWSHADLVFAAAALAMLGWGLVLLSKAITKACARVWFTERERHTKRIIEMSKKEDHT